MKPPSAPLVAVPRVWSPSLTVTLAPGSGWAAWSSTRPVIVPTTLVEAMVRWTVVVLPKRTFTVSEALW